MTFIRTCGAALWTCQQAPYHPDSLLLSILSIRLHSFLGKVTLSGRLCWEDP